MLRLLDLLLTVLRPALFWLALVLCVLAAVDWAVRTRRLSPFGFLGRLARRGLDPWIAPVERTLVRAGGNPTVAPLWAAALAILGGIVLLSVLGFVRDQFTIGLVATQAGPRGVAIVLLRWSFQLLRAALMVRVLCSWIQVSRYSPWVRWAFALSDPILRPLQRVVPPLGMVDITPIVAWLLLGLAENLVIGVFA